jgi:CubicO group peptidase (beta-lactamase class C family)
VNDGDNRLPRSTPEAQGVLSSGIVTFLEAIDKSRLELHGFMMMRYGQVISEGWWRPYEAKRPHMLFSLTKSFTATAVGFAVSEGRLSVEDKVVSFFSQFVNEPVSVYQASMSVRDLLTMSAGHEKPTMGSFWRQLMGSWSSHFLNIPVEHKPGTRFMYNSGATYMLSAIVQSVTGERLLDYLKPRLFEPLGIQTSEWDTSPDGIDAGGWGLTLTTEDLLRFGQFYLQQGKWNGKALLPESWIHEATSLQIDNGSNPLNDSEQGYGYQFWLCRHGAYRADGAFGQFCIIMPEQQAVIAMHGGLTRMQDVLNHVWDYLLPAMKDQQLDSVTNGYDLLKHKLQQLTISVPHDKTDSPIAIEISGKPYIMEENIEQMQIVSFDYKGDCCEFRMQDHRGEHQITCGNGYWYHGTTTMTGNELHHNYQPPFMDVVACGAWLTKHTYVMTWCFVGTPFTDTVVCQFELGRVIIERTVNIQAEASKRPPIIGNWRGYGL